MQEVVFGKKKLAESKQHLYAQLVTYARAHSTPDKQKGRAAHLFKDITGGWPPADFSFDATPNVPIERNTANKIESLKLAFLKGREKERVSATI
ncbi:hypothetical protein D3C86_1978530 [compost metagenome]